MKKLFFLVSLLAMSASMNAQISGGKDVENWPYGVPKLFTYGGNSFMLTETGGESVRTIDVYNDDIEKVRSFQIELPAQTNGYKIVRRKEEVKEHSRDSTQVYDYDYTTMNEKTVFTWDEALEFATARGYSSQQSGYCIYSDSEYGYYNSYTFGKLYPTSYYRWIPETGKLYQCNINYKVTYTGEWETTEDQTYMRYDLPDLYFINYDGDLAYPDDGFIFTQTLFNTDEKFECLLPIYGETQERVTSESDRDDDGEIDQRSIDCSSELKGLRVVSEDGTVLQTVEWEYGDRYQFLNVKICKMNDKIYLVRGHDNGYTFYRIDPTSSSIKKVNDMPASVVARYSVDGRRQSHPRRGVNILRYSDGTAVKVVEK